MTRKASLGVQREDPQSELGRRIEKLRKEHRRAFGARDGSELRLVAAPYRACPLGAHVDHQLGTVTGFALDASVLLAFTPERSGQVRLRSLNFEGEVEFAVGAVPDAIEGDWGNYARGAARALGTLGPLRRGISGVVSGNLPVGGLSSSAAVGLAFLLALEETNGLRLEAEENIRLDQYIENRYIGLDNGILDQSVILRSRRDRLLYLDCRDGAHEHVAAATGTPPLEVAVVYSGLSRSLVATNYNRRVAECRAAARGLLELAALALPPAPVLRDVPEEVFRAHGGALEPPLRRRAEHFFSESRRVPEGVAAWRRGDLAAFGELMTASGRSSIVNYECGGPHLVTLHHLLAEIPGVYGTRFAGAGFRGCAIALVDPARRDEIAGTVRERYASAHPDVAGTFSIHFCRLDDGARLL